MSEETSWFDSAVDFVSDTADSVVETVEDGYDTVVETAEDVYDAVAESETVQRAEDAITHSLRGIEDQIDSDDDGSLLDEVGNTLIEDVPVVGGLIGGIGEELGDFTTDLLGTRDTGLFSEAGTRDADSSDADYREGSTFSETGGLGAALNEDLGIGENDPSDLLWAAAGANPAFGATGALIAGAAELVDGNEDPYVEADPETGYYDYDAEQVAQ